MLELEDDCGEVFDLLLLLLDLLLEAADLLGLLGDLGSGCASFDLELLNSFVLLVAVVDCRRRMLVDFFVQLLTLPLLLFDLPNGPLQGGGDFFAVSLALLIMIRAILHIEVSQQLGENRVRLVGI